MRGTVRKLNLLQAKLDAKNMRKDAHENVDDEDYQSLDGDRTELLELQRQEEERRAEEARLELEALEAEEARLPPGAGRASELSQFSVKE